MVKKDSPDTSYCILNLHFVFFIIDLNVEFNFLFNEFDECLLLNLILNTAFADPGMTLSA